jgi:hypothetical protein
MSSENSTARITANQHIDQRSAFENTFEDALALVTDTRDLLAEKSVSLRSESQLSEQFQEVVILSKLTFYLMHIMDWVVAQKIAIDSASECGRAQRCIPQLNELASFPAKDEACSERLNDLIDRTHGVFARVVRLNEMRGAIKPTTPRWRPSEISCVEGP